METRMETPKVRVLVVDDEKDFLELFVKRFSKRNLDVSCADNGFDGLEFLNKNPVDVVILDVKMPRMDGIEVLKEIKKHHPIIEVIMLTGHGSVDSGIQGMSHGAYDYVMKPFKIDDLLFKIQKAYERKVLNESRA
jgi:DNA-binding NtrC family response regulator